ncbi:hypothetical protein N7522_000115 [Penicillium canescens]|nr:hypothetical protein N7522_000115 [Penicillium canescens]
MVLCQYRSLRSDVTVNPHGRIKAPNLPDGPNDRALHMLAPSPNVRAPLQDSGFFPIVRVPRLKCKRTSNGPSNTIFSTTGSQHWLQELYRLHPCSALTLVYHSPIMP